jgi:aryl-alcohol dehydrogenase-like predicted oxidoreductase
VKLRTKLCIGTVQLGQSYGPQKKIKVISSKELQKFIYFLKKHKIKYLDTASNYKFDKKINTSNISLKDFNIITKIPSPKNYKLNYEKKIILDIKKMLTNFKINSFYAVLLHDSKNLKKKDYLKFLSLVKLLKKMKLTKYYGISVYSQSEFYNFYRYGKPEIVQGQLNIFDNTFLKKNFLYKLKKNKIKFHARSIFLQGVLTTNHTKLRSYFRKWDKQILEWNTFCQNSSHSNLEIATNYVLNNKYVDKIVVGFQDKNELKEFLSIKNNLNKNDINFKSKYNLKNLSLLKPFLWK